MKTVVKVSNLKCGGCATTIEKALRKFIGVENVLIDKQTGEIIVEHSDEASCEKIKEKLLSLGYPEQGSVTGLEAIKADVKSFVSCAIGRIDNLKK